MSLILASASPRRRDLLARFAQPFGVVPSSIVERPPRRGEDPGSFAAGLALQKVREVAGRHPQDVVLAADTVVSVDDVILGKPQTKEDALEMLSLLRGMCHTVLTAAVLRSGDEERVGAVTAEVRMKDFTDQEMEDYVDTGEPMDKAGAYGIQGLGGALVEHVMGCYTSVVGLPLCLTGQFLVASGLITAVPRGARCEHSR